MGVGTGPQGYRLPYGPPLRRWMALPSPVAMGEGWGGGLAGDMDSGLGWNDG